MLRDILSDLRYRLRALFRRDEVERELDEELRFHVERQTAKNIAAGMLAADARAGALRDFGGIERRKEEVREIRGVDLIEHFIQDLSYALRGLRRSPGFTVAVVVTLGLGIGANAAMFSIVDRMLFRPPPMLRDPGLTQRIYLGRLVRGTEALDEGMPYPRYMDLSRWTKSFSRTALFTGEELAIGVGADVVEQPVGIVSASFFDFFDAPPVIGRYFTAAEEIPPEGKPVAVLSYALWESKYGKRNDVLGATIQIGPTRCTIIGVAPAAFVWLLPSTPPAAFIPIPVYTFALPRDFGGRFGPTLASNYDWVFASMIVQRKPEVTTETADADLTNARLRSYDEQRPRETGFAPA